jgi:hypothetical protein
MSTQLLLFEIETVPLSVFWVFFVMFGLGGFFLVRLHPLFLIPILLIISFFFWVQTIDLHDPDIESGIIRQEGYSYIIYLYLLVLIGPIVLSLAGMLAFIRRLDKKNSCIKT